jgi:hypothetical protein
MNRQRIYIDTSVVGGCYDDEFKEWSNKLFDDFITGHKIAVLSDITIEELEDAPKNVKNKINKIPRTNIEFVAIDNDAYNLADQYIVNGAVTVKYKEDAQHIAIASIKNVDVLVSWNFRHIVNLEKIRNYNAVNLKYGYKILEIRTPREVLHEKD